ncbi:MAG: exodeoxyribonuclease VII small subunit [Syntrophales bacterium]|jgi:exodeoxyribonuclease VII small subunit|nr:exodeoxyribonuclease VII small subunit [Syntrophales bacterium]
MSKEKFEVMLAKLEEIVRRMETGEMTLEESLAAFEEGIKLSRNCAKTLDEAQRKVEILLQEGEKLTTAPFVGAESEP